MDCISWKIIRKSHNRGVLSINLGMMIQIIALVVGVALVLEMQDSSLWCKYRNPAFNSKTGGFFFSFWSYSRFLCSGDVTLSCKGKSIVESHIHPCHPYGFFKAVSVCTLSYRYSGRNCNRNHSRIYRILADKENRKTQENKSSPNVIQTRNLEKVFTTHTQVSSNITYVIIQNQGNF